MMGQQAGKGAPPKFRMIQGKQNKKIAKKS